MKLTQWLRTWRARKSNDEAGKVSGRMDPSERAAALRREQRRKV